MSFSCMIICIFPYQRPHVIAHHCAVPTALILLFYLLNSLVKYHLAVVLAEVQDFLERNQDVSIKNEVLMTCDIPSFML